MNFSPKLRNRRGTTAVIAVVGLAAMAATVGTEMDSGRMVVTRHKDQVISDAATMAAAVRLPKQSAAEAAAARVVSQYRSLYGGNFVSDIVWYTNGSGITTGCRVAVTEPVPMLLPALMGVTTRPTGAFAAASRVVPSAMLQGVVPIGVQYNTTFDLPPNAYASPQTLTLKRGDGADNVEPGNFGALRLPGDSGGADLWREYLKYGCSERIAIGDIVPSETGNMVGPGNQALVTDDDSRMNRAAVSPYNDDTWSNFDPGNPRICVIPLVDWTGANGSSPIPIMGFAAFWVEGVQGGTISGRFIRYTVGRSGAPDWEGISVDTDSSNGFDGGLWYATLTS